MKYDPLADDTHKKVAILTYVQLSLGNGCLFLDIYGHYP